MGSPGSSHIQAGRHVAGAAQPEALGEGGAVASPLTHMQGRSALSYASTCHHGRQGFVMGVCVGEHGGAPPATVGSVRAAPVSVCIGTATQCLSFPCCMNACCMLFSYMPDTGRCMFPSLVSSMRWE